MTEPDNDDLPSLDEFGAKLDEAHRNALPEQATNGAALGAGLKIASEMLAAFLVGGALGHGADRLFGTKPWGLLVGFGIGFAAGVLNANRAMKKMDADVAKTTEAEDNNSQ